MKLLQVRGFVRWDGKFGFLEKKKLKRMVRETEILSILAPSGMKILTKPQSKKN